MSALENWHFDKTSSWISEIDKNAKKNRAIVEVDSFKKIFFFKFLAYHFTEYDFFNITTQLLFGV